MGVDPLDRFVSEFASPSPLSILPLSVVGGGRSPTTLKNKSKKLLGGHDKDQGIRSSGHLATKPSYGLPAEKKALMVLLKHSGVVLHDGPPKICELQRYRELYRKPLLPT